MKSFGKTLTHGSDYSSVWPSQPELAPIFPGKRIIYLLNWANRSSLPDCAGWLFAVAVGMLIANGQRSDRSCLFALSLPVQGYYWLGTASRIHTTTHCRVGNLAEINPRCRQPSVNRPNYFA